MKIYNIEFSAVPIHTNIDVDLESQANSLNHFVPPFRITESGNGMNGFTLISDIQSVEQISHKFKVSRFFIKLKIYK